MDGKADANIRYDDLCHLLTRLGYGSSQSSSSHRIFRMAGRDIVNLQRAGPWAKGYQVRQVREQLSKLKKMKAKPNDYEIRIWYSPAPGDACFVAQVLDLPGVMAHGETREEAAREIHLALTLALATYAAAGEEPPGPKNQAAVTLGTRGGSARTKAKRLAARRNGTRGGRPRKSTTVAA